MLTSTRKRSLALLAIAATCIALLTATTAVATPAPAATSSPTEPCDSISPIAIPCVALGKTFDALAYECRRVGIPDTQCTLPLAHKVTQAARDAYLTSWVHRTAQFQYKLSQAAPLADSLWLGTHNSFNSLENGLTLSHADSNQQLTLSQQLDIDMRSLELDLHYVPRLELLGAKAVTVCHGQPPSSLDFGCTFEPTLAQTLPEIANWLNAPGHGNEVIMLYLEDEMKNEAAYASTVATLEKVLKRPNGTSLIWKPNPAAHQANGCSPLPQRSRAGIRDDGAQVVLVGACAPGWSADVFDWNGVHVEGGSTAAYQPYPACDATYDSSVYSSKLVRYFEDSTLVSTLLNPTRPPADPDALTPEKVEAMTQCGVNLFGFDQILPEDGRIQSTLWTWAPDEPRAGAGNCTVLRANGRWYAAPCTEIRPAACVVDWDIWALSAPTTVADAPSACSAIGGEFATPVTIGQQQRLRSVTGSNDVWLRYAIP